MKISERLAPHEWVGSSGSWGFIETAGKYPFLPQMVYFGGDVKTRNS
jgi:hypothetical protein